MLSTLWNLYWKQHTRSNLQEIVRFFQNVRSRAQLQCFCIYEHTYKNTCGWHKDYKTKIGRV